MKKNKLVLLTATGLLVAGLAGVKASAAEDKLIDDSHHTATEVQIVDKTNPDGPDEPTPGDEISLEHVPTKFAFETVVKNKQYTLTNQNSKVEVSADNTIDVFNNKSTRDWNVKANIIQILKDSTTPAFKVDSFKIAGVEVETGTQGIVHQAGEKTEAGNTGLIKSAEIENVEISFKDANGILKAGDKLSGLIKYTLTATPAAN